MSHHPSYTNPMNPGAGSPETAERMVLAARRQAVVRMAGILRAAERNVERWPLSIGPLTRLVAAKAAHAEAVRRLAEVES